MYQGQVADPSMSKLRDRLASIAPWWARTALRAQADRLHRERETLESMLGAAPEPMWRRAPDLRIAWCNAPYAALVGGARTAPKPDTTAEMCASARELARKAQRTGERMREVRSLIVDGERRVYEVVERPLGRGGEIAGFARDVTAHEETKADLARHVEAHATVLQSLATPVEVYGPDQRLLFFNPAFARLWRLDADWLTGHPSQGEVLEAMRERRMLPETVDFRAFKEGRQRLFTNLIEPLEELMHLPDGTTLRLVVNPHPHGGLLYFYEDVSDRLALERTRNLQIAVQKAMLDNLREAVAVFGGDGRLTLFNHRYAEMWRLDEAFLATRPHVRDIAERWRLLMHGADDWEELRERMVMSALERAGGVHGIERPDGAIIDHASVPLPDGAVLTACIDVTDPIRIERALRDRNEALEAADLLKSKFLESVSYTLRTPLNTIMGFDELLMKPFFGELNPRQREYAEGILESSRQLLLLIDDILDLASIEAGRMELRKTRIDLRATLAAVVRQTRAGAARRGLKLAVECDRDIGAMVADGRRIGEVLGDLMNYAIAVAPPEGAVAIGARREGDEVALWVADTGGGIEADRVEAMFGAFRGEARLQDRDSGVRIALAKSIVELHGERIEVDSEPGWQTRVTCTMPSPLAPEEAVPDRSPRLAASA